VSSIGSLISTNNVPLLATLFTSSELWRKVAVQWHRSTVEGSL
jgi:hypothetical protein